MGVERLDHLFDVVGAAVHELVSEESFALLLDALVHFSSLFHVLQVILGLLVPLLYLVHLLLSYVQLLVDVSPEGIVCTDKFLALLLGGTGLRVEHLPLFALDLVELPLEIINLEL